MVLPSRAGAGRARARGRRRDALAADAERLVDDLVARLTGRAHGDPRRPVAHRRVGPELVRGVAVVGDLGVARTSHCCAPPATRSSASAGRPGRCRATGPGWWPVAAAGSRPPPPSGPPRWWSRCAPPRSGSPRRSRDDHPDVDRHPAEGAHRVGGAVRGPQRPPQEPRAGRPRPPRRRRAGCRRRVPHDVGAAHARPARPGVRPRRRPGPDDVRLPRHRRREREATQQLLLWEDRDTLPVQAVGP